MSDVLLVIDTQRALLDELEPSRRAEFVAALAPVIEQARGAGLPVVYVRHDGSPQELVPGTPPWEIGHEVAPRAGEPIVEKRFADAFQETNLTEVLEALAGDHVIVTGMQTDVCVSATAKGAAERGYRVTVVADAHATSPSNGKTEVQIREAMHDESRARGARIVPAAELFTPPRGA